MVPRVDWRDRNKKENRIEDNLEQEIQLTLKRKKILEHINDAIEKNAQIIVINLTFSSLGLGFAKYGFNRFKDFSIQKGLRKSILFAEHIKTNISTNAIPVVILTTLINSIQNKYQFFSFAFLYPLNESNNQKIADDRTLNIKLNNY